MSCTDPNVANIILGKNKENTMVLEDDGVGLIHMKIASAFLEDEYPKFEDIDYMIASRIFDNALVLYRETQQSFLDLGQIYPVLQECIRRCQYFENKEEDEIGHAYNVIAHSNTYASHIEVEIACHLLSNLNIRLFVISQNTNKTQAVTTKNWMRDFRAFYEILNKSDENKDIKMAILINVDDIHYNIFKFCGSYVFSWVVFYNYMSDSDSDFNFDEMD